MSQADNIQEIELSDGGDGSTCFKFTFKDGSTYADCPDLPYGGRVTYTRQPDGSLLEEVTYE